MINYRIHLIRTGTTQTGAKRCYVGQTDTPLSDRGREHLAAMKEAFDYPNVNLVYTSPLVRAVETAEFLYPETQVIPMNGFTDMNLGSFEGKSYSELEDNIDFIRWIKNSAENSPPGGESITAFTERVVTATDSIFSEMMDQQLTDVGLITHSGVIMILLAAIGIPKLPMDRWTTENGAGFTLTMTPQMWMRDFSGEVSSRIPILKVDPSQAGSLDDYFNV